MYDDVAMLKKYEKESVDKYGNRTVKSTDTKVFVQPKGIYASEFYSASQLGLRPSITFVLAHRDDYDGQKVIEFHGVEYSIIRVDWNAQRDKISLICEERLKNG